MYDIERGNIEVELQVTHVNMDEDSVLSAMEEGDPTSTQQVPQEIDQPIPSRNTSTPQYDLICDGNEERVKDASVGQVILQWWTAYLRKFGGVEGKAGPPIPLPMQIILSSILGFIGIFLVSTTDEWFLSRISVEDYGIRMMTGAYAATAG
jgi:hypothetical protein